MDYLKTLFNLENKVVALSGGADILAGEMARGFLHIGAKVVLLDIIAEKLKKQTEILSRLDNDIIGLPCNVLDARNLRDTRTKILKKFNHIDILINAGGGNMVGATIGINQSFFDLKIEQFKNVTDLNLNGTVLPALIFGKSMTD